MPSYISGIGKGLREPCSPFRTAQVFGVPLNQVDADNWYCNAEITEPTTSFDLSGIEPSHEVVVALIAIYGTNEGPHALTFRYYRERDNALLFQYTYTYSAPPAGSVYSYAYIGYVDWEIAENGDYRVELQVIGAGSFSRTIYFTVSGIPGEEPPPGGLVIDFMADIRQRLLDIGTQLYGAYITVYEWVTPFNLLATPLYWVSQYFLNLVSYWDSFTSWVSAVTNLIATIFSWESLQALIRSWLVGIENLISWFYSWWENVQAVIDDWWLAASPAIQGWISAAVQPFNNLLAQWNDFWYDIYPDFTGFVYGFYSSWQNFLAGTLPDLVSFSWLTNWWTSTVHEVQGLIDSAFTARDTLWAGWQDIRSQVLEFFTDPWGWLYNRFDDFIDRYW